MSEAGAVALYVAEMLVDSCSNTAHSCEWVYHFRSTHELMRCECAHCQLHGHHCKFAQSAHIIDASCMNDNT